MLKNKKVVYFCQECGYESSKWMGQCPGCRAWNTFVEETVSTKKVSSTGSGLQNGLRRAEPVVLKDIRLSEDERKLTNIGELDRVLGGGIVPGSLVLVGGDPGIGKSTLLLQVCRNLAMSGNSVLYISGEESLRQIKLRAERIGEFNENLQLLCETNLETIREVIERKKPDMVVIDSIQTMNLSELNSSPGSITQVRESANMLMRTAKGLDIPMFIVGHVNKEGSIAGPKVLEHIVDTVLHFEGDKQMSCRILRAVKNRYGSTNEIGVFEMTDKGLNEVANPSVMLLSGRPKNVSGTCVTCTIEGSRPILAETQGLATQSGYGNARRMVTGYDYNRLSMVLAVLEKRAGYYFSNCDTYINIVGGLRVDEPAIDLSIAMALISSLKDTPIDENAVVFGEIGLAGEIRAVSNAQMRINEAVRLGFTKIILPYHNLKGVSCDDAELIGVKNIRQAFEAVGQ